MKKQHQYNIFGTENMKQEEAILLSIESLRQYGPAHPHWVIAWSGGKDSTALLCFIIFCIESGLIDRPERLTVCYADTRVEIPPLWWSALEIMENLRRRGIEVRVVTAPIHKRLLPYILGYGVPAPTNRMRWCTNKIKLEPMQAEIEAIYAADGKKSLVLTGVRQGESAIRDGRIAMSCSKDGAECGQGWYQQALSDSTCATLAPLLHWRVCHVWDWLDWSQHPNIINSLGLRFNITEGFNTKLLADTYGGDEREEINARTGCIGCPLTTEDKGLKTVVSNPEFAYLYPLLQLHELFWEYRKKKHRLKKPWGETTKAGKMAAKQGRLGPLTMKARREFTRKVLAIQRHINAEAIKNGWRTINILNVDELRYIVSCWRDGVYPQKWDGTEPVGSDVAEHRYGDGTIQGTIFTGLQ